MKLYLQGKWELLESEAEMMARVRRPEPPLARYNVMSAYWQGPGWYWVETYQKYDIREQWWESVIEFTHITDRIQHLKERMQELADGLREARAKMVDHMARLRRHQ